MSTGAERPSHQLLQRSGSRNRLFSSNPNCKKPARGSLTSAVPTGKKKGEKQEARVSPTQAKRLPKQRSTGRQSVLGWSVSCWISHRGFAKTPSQMDLSLQRILPQIWIWPMQPLVTLMFASWLVSPVHGWEWCRSKRSCPPQDREAGPG